MKNKIVNSISKDLNILTKKKFSKKYISKYILPIIDNVANSKQKKILISGSQGIGKSTLLKIIEKNALKYYEKKILTLSLDDYYLSKKERIILSKKIHPLLITRGVPGTHDINKLIKDIISFHNKKYPIIKPIFDKLKDDRSNKKSKIIKKADILILEGWCCGSPPIEKKYLYKNINFLEKNKDPQMIWRNFYNQKLKNEYANLFNLFEKKIFLQSPTFNYVLNWRSKQEKMMIKKNNKKIMNEKELKYFISHYEKITKFMIKVLPKKADIVIKIDKNQRIKELIYN
tara:strand:- start:101 stop:961 length:861 start_codon:yes stop_codon:yes gene_type:complete